MDEETSSIKCLVDTARELYHSTFTSLGASKHNDDYICTVAPGRVNLIGEHTDYTGGFVFPMAIGYSTVCLGTGSITDGSSNSAGICEIISVNANNPQIVTFESSQNMKPFPSDSDKFWANYIIGVVAQYMEDLKGTEYFSISFKLVVNGDVPLGSGLSSSASLEVSVATFIEVLMSKYLPKKHIDKKTKALRCQTAENIFCNSPCGIMDQYVSAAALPGSALLIDCRSLDYETVIMGSKHDNRDKEKENPIFVVCNSNVKHSIGGGEYPVRVAQCKIATENLQAIHGQRIQSLRDASVSDVELAWKQSSSTKEGELTVMDELIYRRAKHVVKENERTLCAKTALIEGNWEEFGKLMNQSHDSMKLDYEVSCTEIDVLVDLAQNFEGVYGSRLTGGGFGGCTVTLVKESRVEALRAHLLEGYKAQTGIESTCFQTVPCTGARELIL